MEDVVTWGEDRGFIKRRKQSVVYKTLDYLYDKIKQLIPNAPRYLTIWQHYRRGHSVDSEFECMEGRCAEFNAIDPQAPEPQLRASAQ
jgi:hypothetical protein